MTTILNAPAGWSARGFVLRAATDRDDAFLRRLYGSFRAEELQHVEWPDAFKTQFLDSQFDFQKQHFTSAFTGADFLIVEQARKPIGRLYLHRAADGWLVVDIGFLPEWRGRGLGEDLLRHVRDLARDAGAPRVTLHVAVTNPRAHALYTRLGFTLVENEGAYLSMEWPVS